MLKKDLRGVARIVLASGLLAVWCTIGRNAAAGPIEVGAITGGFTNGNLELSVAATGYDLHYQWFVNDVSIDDIGSATSGKLVISNALPRNGGKYHVSVYNASDAVASVPTLVQSNSQNFLFSDHLANATNLRIPAGATNAYFYGNNFGATVERQRGPGPSDTRDTEPPIDGKSAKHSVWARWSNPGWAGVAFFTHGSTFWTRAAVYQCTGGTNCLCDSEANPLVSHLKTAPVVESTSANGFVKIKMKPLSGACYWIAIDSYIHEDELSEEGLITLEVQKLNWDPPPEFGFTTQPNDRYLLPSTAAALSAEVEVEETDVFEWQGLRNGVVFTNGNFSGTKGNREPLRMTVSTFGTYQFRVRRKGKGEADWIISSPATVRIRTRSGPSFGVDQNPVREFSRGLTVCGGVYTRFRWFGPFNGPGIPDSVDLPYPNEDGTNTHLFVTTALPANNGIDCVVLVKVLGTPSSDKNCLSRVPPSHGGGTVTLLTNTRYSVGVGFNPSTLSGKTTVALGRLYYE